MSVRVWDLDKGELVCNLQGHRCNVFQVAITSDNLRVISCGADGVRLWSIEEKKEVGVLQYLRKEVVSFAYRGGKVVVGLSDFSVRGWDIETLGEFTYDGHVDRIKSISFVGGLEYMVTVALDNCIGVWNVREKTRKALMRGHEREIRGVVVKGDRKYAVSASYDMTFRVWKLRVG